MPNLILLSEYLTHHEHHGNLLNLQNPRGNVCIEQQRLLIFRAPQAGSFREKKTDSARRPKENIFVNARFPLCWNLCDD